MTQPTTVYVVMYDCIDHAMDLVGVFTDPTKAIQRCAEDDLSDNEANEMLDMLKNWNYAERRWNSMSDSWDTTGDGMGEGWIITATDLT